MWTCPDCGKEMKRQGSHLDTHKGDYKVVLEDITEDEDIPLPVFDDLIEPGAFTPGGLLCPKCGCVDTLTEWNRPAAELSLLRCRMCGTIHSYNVAEEIFA